jgi:hypothetical protein
MARPALLHKTACVTLQPFTDPALSSQDRYVVLQLDVATHGQWGLTAVFDGKNELNRSLFVCH